MNTTLLSLLSFFLSIKIKANFSQSWLTNLVKYVLRAHHLCSQIKRFCIFMGGREPDSIRYDHLISVAHDRLLIVPCGIFAHHFSVAMWSCWKLAGIGTFLHVVWDREACWICCQILFSNVRGGLWWWNKHSVQDLWWPFLLLACQLHPPSKASEALCRWENCTVRLAFYYDLFKTYL